MLSELFDLISKRLDPDMLGAIAGRLGLGGEDTKHAVATSLPALLGGMAHSAQTPEGATRLLKHIDASNGGGSLDGLLERYQAHETVQDTHDTNFFSGLLSGGILDALIGRLGIGGPVVKKLLGLLGPIVIGALGKLGGAGKLSPTGLLSMLTGAAGGAADAAPGGRSGLASLLGPIAGLLGLGGGAAAAVDAVGGSVGNVVDTVAERERATAAAAANVPEAAAAVETAAPAAAVAEESRRKGAGWMWGAIALAGVLAAIVAGKGCGDDSAKVATPTNTVTTEQPAATGNFTLATSGDGKVTLSGSVPTEEAKTTAFTGAEAAWGAGNVTNNLTVDANAGAGPAADVLAKTIAALKGAGTGWTAAFTGTDHLVLTGEVASAAVKKSIFDAATAAFAPNMVEDQMTVKAGATEEAKKAVADINKEISLRGVTFVTGSANLTPASRTTLDRVAKLLDEADEVRAQVQGHTDNQGDAAANLALSTARAKAVVAYLVGKGIASNRLVAKGFGQTKPIASNGTEAGRAKNRRVVFAVIG